MRDLFFTYNTSKDVMNETKVEFLTQKDSKWNIRVNNKETEYSVTMYNDSNGAYYDLEYKGERFQNFEFDTTIYYVPNLFQIWEGVINHSKSIFT
jgi:hypothetical protein